MPTVRSNLDPALHARLAAIELIVLDVDGVLTDGTLHYDSGGGESRAFYVRDGLGIRVGERAGLRFAIISGRRSAVVERRADELGITEVHLGIARKGDKLRELLERCGVSAEATCFIGDDVIDLPAMRLCGVSATPSDGAAEVQAEADYITRHPGGGGAVREVIDLVLHASGRWEGVMQELFA